MTRRARLSPDAVVDAAATIADDSGLEALTLAAVAAALGVRTPSLYAHVGGFDDLRRRLGIRGAQDLERLLGQAAVGRSQRAALTAAAHAYRRYAHEHPGTYAAAQRAPDPADELAVTAAARVVDVLRAVLDGYDVRGEDAVHAIRAIRCGLHGFVALEAAGGFGMPESVDESFARMLEILDAGLRATTPSAAAARARGR
ncbi:MAG: TetR-like C-terminal domain-containing protein [Solirubrobacteraceae bacterium]|nr:TetR-like C-terminal domain-containing protein [Solirubrobacteraceae bacterium]